MNQNHNIYRSLMDISENDDMKIFSPVFTNLLNRLINIENCLKMMSNKFEDMDTASDDFSEIANQIQQILKSEISVKDTITELNQIYSKYE